MSAVECNTAICVYVREAVLLGLGPASVSPLFLATEIITEVLDAQSYAFDKKLKIKKPQSSKEKNEDHNTL
jgi:hypothetical protein